MSQEQNTKKQGGQSQKAPRTNSRPPQKKTVPRRPRGSGGKTAAQVVVSVVLVGLAGYACFSMYRSLTPISQGSEDLTLSVQSPTENTEPPTEATIYENVAVDNAQVHAGDLILVNNNYGYTENNTDEITSVYSYKTEHDVSSYYVSGSEIGLRQKPLEALTEMLDDFYVATGHDDIIILSGYRTNAQQQELYDNDLAETGLDTSERVARPGYSEHETGYALDVSIYQDGYVLDYDGTGDYEWINQNCAKYGYILRYTEEKTDVTGFQAEPWHYRYVGQPHATYMMENDLCLEEYILLLTSYTSENHLKITNWDGEIYEVYYVPADTSADSTYVMVPPDQEYTISGNNLDGFIVTVDTGEIQAYEEVSDGSTSGSTSAAEGGADLSEETTPSEEENTGDALEDEA